MVAGIAHELNNPLTGIAGFSELLLKEKLDEKHSEKIQLINAQANRASSIVKDLMVFSKQKAEEKKPVNINDLLNQAEKMVAYGFKNHNIKLEKSLPDSIPIIYADANRLLQVFINILKNSYQNMTKHNPTGTITISTCVEENTPMRERNGNASDAIIILFKDEGTGIDRQIIKKIFDPFFSLSEAKDSIGLGLSITHSIVKEHGGEIIVTTEEGRGTKTQIYLPVPESAEYSDKKKAPEIIRKGETVMPAKALILVISDDNVFANFKARHSVKPTFETSLKGALERIKNEYFHLVLFDLDIKNITAKDFYREAVKIREDIGKFLMFTGSETPAKETARLINIIGNSYIQKPFSREKIRFLFHSIVNIESLK